MQQTLHPEKCVFLLHEVPLSFQRKKISRKIALNKCMFRPSDKEVEIESREWEEQRQMVKQQLTKSRLMRHEWLMRIVIVTITLSFPCF